MSLIRRVNRVRVAVDNDSNYHVTIRPSGIVYKVSIAQKTPPTEPTLVGTIDPAVQPLALVISGSPVVLTPGALAEVSMAVSTLVDVAEKHGGTLIVDDSEGGAR